LADRKFTNDFLIGGLREEIETWNSRNQKINSSYTIRMPNDNSIIIVIINSSTALFWALAAFSVP
jgi:hypothetical protein